MDGLDDLVPLIVSEYGAGTVGAFLGREVETVGAAARGLVEYLGAWAAAPASTATQRAPGPTAGWDYSFGDAYRTLHNDGGDPVGVAASLAMHLGAQGLPGSWTADLDHRLRLRWGDWLLPETRQVTVETDGATARVTYATPTGRGSVELRVVDGRWHADGADPVTRVNRHGISFELLTRDALAMREYEDLLQRAVTQVDARMLDVFDQAIDIIAEFTPEYLPWVSRTVQQVFLIAPRPGRVESGSVEHYLGLVHLTQHPEPLPVAELLVHEATHQYMNVVAKLQPLDDGSDERTYWSPAVQTDRPVSKIVAAFHAFGNVILFYRHCRENGLGNQSECARQEALLGGWMDDFVPPIIDNPALTATGNGLCRPLLAELGYT